MENAFAAGAAMRTHADVLSPAAYQEFATEVGRRWSHGEQAAARGSLGISG